MNTEKTINHAESLIFFLLWELLYKNLELLVDIGNRKMLRLLHHPHCQDSENTTDHRENDENVRVR